MGDNQQSQHTISTGLYWSLVALLVLVRGLI
jgi:hypothetical protein